MNLGLHASGGIMILEVMDDCGVRGFLMRQKIVYFKKAIYT